MILDMDLTIFISIEDLVFKATRLKLQVHSRNKECRNQTSHSASLKTKTDLTDSRGSNVIELLKILTWKIIAFFLKKCLIYFVYIWFGKICKGSMTIFLRISKQNVSKRCQHKSTCNVRDRTTFDPRQSVRSVILYLSSIWTVVLGTNKKVIDINKIYFPSLWEVSLIKTI